MTFEKWALIGQKLQHVEGSINWWLGDWLNEGEHRYGEMYTQAIEVTGNSLENLKQYKYVASSVKKLTRVNLLSWTHHRYVAHLPDVEQRMWLEHAAEHELSSRDLKHALAAANALQPALPKPELEWVVAEFDPDEDGEDFDPDEDGEDFDPDEDEEDFDLDEDEDDEDFDPEPDDDDFDPEPDDDDFDPNAVPAIRMRRRKRAHVANNSGNVEWYTPMEYIEAARTVLGKIDLDPASNIAAQMIVQAGTFYTQLDDGLAYDWHGRVFMNPPYAGDLIQRFTQKLCRHYSAGDIPEAIVLVNNATETTWFQDLAMQARAICFPSRRIRFWSPNGTHAQPLQGQAILYIGDNVGLFDREFVRFGLVFYGLGVKHATIETWTDPKSESLRQGSVGLEHSGALL